MARICALACLLATAFAAPASAATTKLRVQLWPDGDRTSPPRVWTLACGPVAGTLPHAAAACRKLARLRAPFAPVPAGIACSQIYGGPQLARVTGRFRGVPVWATFKRTDACQTARWNRVAFLFPH
jgi:hypothetical protein